MLGTPSLVLFGLVYMVPLTVFTTYGIVTQMTGGRLSVAYLVTLAAMVFTARSYARMAAAYPVAGSAYTYTQKSFGAPIGFLAGWSLLLDYLFLPMLNYLVIGIYMSAAMPAVPPWVWILVAIAVGDGTQHRRHRVGVAGQRSSSSRLQFIFIVVFVVMSIALDLRIRQREPDGAARRRRHRRRIRSDLRRCGACCACPSSDSTRSRRCPKKRRTPNALCPRRS